MLQLLRVLGERAGVRRQLGDLRAHRCNRLPDRTGVRKNCVVRGHGIARSLGNSGRAGSLLGLAQGNLAKADWSALTKMIPGASSLVSQAKTMGGIDKFTNMAGLSSAFSKMGLTTDQVNTLTPAVKDYVTRDLFEGLMKAEESHIDYLETQLQLVATLGLELYAQHHIGKVDE